MSLLDSGFADEFVGGCGAEIVLDIGFERGLVALEGEQVIGLMNNDLIGNLDFSKECRPTFGWLRPDWKSRYGTMCRILPKP